MRVVPQAFYNSPSIKVIMADGLSCVIQKSVTAPNTHNERYLSAHALTFVTEGRLLIETSNGDFNSVNAGEYVFLPRGLYLISDILPQSGVFSAVVYFFAEDLIAEFLQTNRLESRAESTAPSGPFTARAEDDFRLFQRSLLNLYANRTPNLQFPTRQKLLELLFLLCRSTVGENFTNHLLRLQQRNKVNLRDFIEANFCKALAVADFAYLTGRSPSTFQRDFKRVFGHSPKAWLTERRLSEAARLLQEPESSAGTVAQQVGYNNLSHFVRVFRLHYGITPKQYR